MRRIVWGIGISSLGVAAAALAADIIVQPGPGDGFVVLNNAGTIERLRVDEATGNISKDSLLFLHESGGNLFVGKMAGNAAVTGGDNIAFGQGAMNAINLGTSNTAFGMNTLEGNTTGDHNAAFGNRVMNIVGNGSENSGFGFEALLFNSTDGNSAFGYGALRLNSTGPFNAAFGHSALASNTAGNQNAAFGHGALQSNITGHSNSSFGYRALDSNDAVGNSAFGSFALFANTAINNDAFGSFALNSNTTGQQNAAFGSGALQGNVAGSANSAFGQSALDNIANGDGNIAFGSNALGVLTSGDGNIAIGASAGLILTSGTNNIYIGNAGVSSEGGRIRIGRLGAHAEAFIQGISGNTVTGSAVLVRSNGELGVATSSVRFKEAVRDMGESSEMLMKLRPVTFRYREAIAAGEDVQEYGLIAEEVAEVAPELVALDAEGRPYSVRYHVLPSLLLNEVQNQQRTIHDQREAIEAQQQVITALMARVEVVERRLSTTPDASSQ